LNRPARLKGKFFYSSWCVSRQGVRLFLVPTWEWMKMALRGPAAKAIKHGKTPNADWVDVPDAAYAGPSPDLPKLANRRKWTDLVVQWWEQVRTMPHCVLWEPTDWQFAIETALMKDQFWREYADGEMKSTAATEIRRREAVLGTTAEARRQLRIRYVPSGEGCGDDTPQTPVVVQEVADTLEGGSVATVTPIADRRARLSRSA
jgi:hypothetical protein